jgi:hypothetical protein
MYWHFSEMLFCYVDVTAAAADQYAISRVRRTVTAAAADQYAISRVRRTVNAVGLMG